MRIRLIALSAFAFIAPAFAHDIGPGAWINHGRYVSPIDGQHCCGEHDCFEIDSNDVRETAGGYWLLKLNEMVPRREVQNSRDGHYWRCKKADGTRRCFFAPPPGV
jgi:hypothetical protein